MRKKLLSKLLIASGVILAVNGISLATNLEGYYEDDVTPPWGRISVKSALKVNDINYVDSENIIIELYAVDDKCKEDEIKYHVSTTPIGDLGKLESGDWHPYSLGATAEVTLPNLDTTNTVYAVFKDKNGNTSHIYSGATYQQTIIFDMNTTDETEFATGLNTTRWHGAPYIIPSQIPKREGYYFIGWSTDPSADASFYAEDIVPADVELGTDETTATLYAVWSPDKSELPFLADVVEIGDYVNYPVVYDNVVSYTSNGTDYKSTSEGWRVIGKEDDGTVNLVSAGVPLTFSNNTNQANSIPALTTNFLSTRMGVGSEIATFRKNGFGPYLTLEAVFTNKYTATENSLPKVRSMVQEDIFKVTGHIEMASGSTMGLNNAKYNGLFANGACYWLASPDPGSTYYLWLVYDTGNVYYYGNNEFGVRPVVSLKSEVRATGKDIIGVWNIEI